MLKELIFCLTVASFVRQNLGKQPDQIGFANYAKLYQVQRLLSQIEKQKETMSCLCDMVNNSRQKYNNKQGAAIYVRWGRTTCPGNGTELMYSGFAAGSWYDNKGGASNYLCLPKNPDWSKYQDSDDKSASAKIYGTEYESHSHVVGEALDKSHVQYEVPCAVCQNKIRTGVYMLPGKTTCFPGWTREYRGYLMSGHYLHSSADYICVDAHPEHIGSKSNENGRLLYPVEAVCGSLKCPPYVNNRELTCSVCTR